MFSCQFCEISHKTFFKEPFGWLFHHKHSFCLYCPTVTFRNCGCECDKSSDVGVYLDYENCKYRKKIS